MTSARVLTPPLITASIVAYEVSRVVCPNALYEALAETFLAACARRPAALLSGPSGRTAVKHRTGRPVPAVGPLFTHAIAGCPSQREEARDIARNWPSTVHVGVAR